MNLDEAQKTKVREWLDQGLKLSEIQSKLASELNVRLTYMELRFLLDDLKLKPKDVEPPKPPPDLSQKTKPAAPVAEQPEEEDRLAGSNVSVTVDQITRPGALVSGKVTFSDGKQAEWYLDNAGRLAVAPKEKGYKPSQQDVMDFQVELQNALARMGYA